MFTEIINVPFVRVPLKRQQCISTSSTCDENMHVSIEPRSCLSVQQILIVIIVSALVRSSLNGRRVFTVHSNGQIFLSFKHKITMDATDWINTYLTYESDRVCICVIKQTVGYQQATKFSFKKLSTHTKTRQPTILLARVKLAANLGE